MEKIKIIRWQFGLEKYRNRENMLVDVVVDVDRVSIRILLNVLAVLT